MKHLTLSSHFQKQFKKLFPKDQKKVSDLLKEFMSALKEGDLPKGLGFKKINHDKYEIRADIRLRIAMKLDKDTFFCHVIGDHNSINRYLSHYRNK